MCYITSYSIWLHCIISNCVAHEVHFPKQVISDCDDHKLLEKINLNENVIFLFFSIFSTSCFILLSYFSVWQTEDTTYFLNNVSTNKLHFITIWFWASAWPERSFEEKLPEHFMFTLSSIVTWYTFQSVGMWGVYFVTGAWSTFASFSWRNIHLAFSYLAALL